ncbi:uncharacterized protein LOC134256323 [Saccostrea cucullata]|uniref:uncharacterized protein LOC134256323 n=1 Tax=Saccostrea cuccullata TaxID=36930 RepID=UPI002ED35299
MENEDGLKCSVGHYAGSSCGLYKPYPKETDLKILGDCQRDISLHLHAIKLSGGHQTAVTAAADSEGSLIALRIGLFRCDPSMTVCPFHRYGLGIHWKPPRKCTYPSHEGTQKPQKAVNAEMSRNILKCLGVLLVIGSGICKGCLKSYSKDISSLDNEKDSLSHVSIESTGISFFS